MAESRVFRAEDLGPEERRVVEKLLGRELQRSERLELRRTEGGDEREMSPEEWVKELYAWAESHDPSLPVLSDEAMSRESIYPDRA